MPETEYEFISKECLQMELRSRSNFSSYNSSTKDLIILDCRSSNEYSECHIRSAVNFSIPSIMLRRLAAGKIDLLSTIKSPDLKERIQSGYKVSQFILYNDVGVHQQQQQQSTLSLPVQVNQQQQSNQNSHNCGLDLLSGNHSSGGGGGGHFSGGDGGGGIASGSAGDAGGGCITCSTTSGNNPNTTNASDTIINILHRRLKQDGCQVVSLNDGFTSFRQAFPEWCDDDGPQSKDTESSRTTQADQLMGLRSLRISTPHSDSACSSSTESSDCESSNHHNINEAPVEIIPGLFLGNESHSCDSQALQKYNIKYVLNVTPDLPNVFEESGDIQYLQIPITDHYSQDLAMHFPAAIKFIEEARSKNSAVLVHCLAGVSRSVTVTLAYLMHTRAYCLNDAFNLVRDRKPDVSPNFHFMQQLHSFEKKLCLNANSDYSAMDESNSNDIMLASSSGMRSPQTGGSMSSCCGRGSKFDCNCISNDCKCMQTGSYLTQLGNTIGVSPDSGIEFDRWTPSADTGLK